MIKISDFISSPSYENIIFTKNATEAINLVAHSFTKDFIKEGDEIIISQLEHHANIIPWHLAQNLHKFKLVAVCINDIGEINYKDLWNDHGVFTTMWIYGKPPKILFFKSHINNLVKSLKVYKIYI